MSDPTTQTYLKVSLYTRRTRRLSDFDPWDFVSLLWVKHGPHIPAHTGRMVYDILDYARKERKARLRYKPAGLCPVPDVAIATDVPTPDDCTVLGWFSGANPNDWYTARMLGDGHGPTVIARGTGRHKTQVCRDIRRMAAAIAA